MAADAAACARYNASPKGKARKRRYETTESGRAVRRAAERRRYRAKIAARRGMNAAFSEHGEGIG